MLRTRQKLQPYAHEWVGPIPLYIDGAGVAVGRYHDLIALTLDVLRQTDEDLLRQAWFDPSLLAELALDPRAYDFDHPVNRRPNYHFGGWDLHKIDNKGHYRRFVLQQVTLDSILERVESRGDRSHGEMLYEAAAVLAGTMLMGSGVSGNGPGRPRLAVLAGDASAAHRRLSGRVLRRIAGPGVGASIARRLKAEARRLRQPFGGARQDLEPEARPPSGRAVAARAPGAAVRADGLHRGRHPPGRARPGRLGADALPDRLPARARPT